MLKYGLDKVLDDVQLLVSRMRAREEAADLLGQQVSTVKSQLLSMKQYQEEMLDFNEFSKLVANRPKGRLMLCLAAENKQLGELRMENKTLRNSLDEHETALDMIMTKYRYQISKLMQTNQVEHFVQSIMNSENDEDQIRQTKVSNTTCASGSETNTDTPNQNIPNKPQLNTFSELSAQDGGSQTGTSNPLVNEQMAAIAAIVRDVTDQGDAYATELEKEIHRLRAENSGLRELLSISNDYCADLSPTDSAHVPSVTLPNENLNLLRSDAYISGPQNHITNTHERINPNSMHLGQSLETRLLNMERPDDFHYDFRDHLTHGSYRTGDRQNRGHPDIGSVDDDYDDDVEDLLTITGNH